MLHPHTNAAWRRLARWYRWLLMAVHGLFWAMMTILVMKLLFLCVAHYGIKPDYLVYKLYYHV